MDYKRQDINTLLSDIQGFMDSYESLTTKMEFINDVREYIHENGPFKNEPVDFVRWVVTDDVIANEYNPNKVAPPEMELLEVSIMNDGYTQPIVTWPNNDKSEVVDGFHRSRVGRESAIVKERIMGFLPTVAIRNEQASKNDRIASTIRHNRARGKHQVDAMSEIILELKNRNWKNSRIARELGMDEEEILRLCQITGLQDVFSDDDFSKSWIASDSTESPFEELTDDLTNEEVEKYRTVNTNDPDRIFHTFDKWECHKAGFYASKFEGKKKDECEQSYANFLSNDTKFKEALNGVISKWKHSCEHYLTNKSMNRIAWLGQAAMCYGTGIPSVFCAGFNRLTPDEQERANNIALEYLNIWLKNNNRNEVEIEEALSLGRQVNIY
jgi:hypothetical protein